MRLQPRTLPRQLQRPKPHALKLMNEPVDPVSGFVRFKVDFAYDGTDFNGWAMQPGLRTVQGEFLEALTVIFGPDDKDFGLRVAGRTDAGVHARHQVLHIDLTPVQLKRLGRHNAPEIRDDKLKGRLNSLLPKDVRVYTLAPAPEGFDARFSAIHRRYRYRIADRFAVKDPIEARNTLWINKPLNTDDMQIAANQLLGLNDFAAFCKPRDFSTTIRDLKEITVKRRIDENHVVELELMADAFCHNMVRAIVGALIAVGEGRAKPIDVKTRLDAANRVGSYKVVGSHGLALIEIGYPADELLGIQASESRARRTLEESDQE